MHEILIDGTVYRTCATAEDAAALRASLRRWASTSTRIETRPAGCALCGGSAEYRHYAFRQGQWVPIKEPCPRCRPPLPPVAALVSVAAD